MESEQKYRLYKNSKAAGDAAQWKKFQDMKLKKWGITWTRLKFIYEREVGDLEGGNTKPFWQYLESLCQVSFGVPALLVGGQLFLSA